MSAPYGSQPYETNQQHDRIKDSNRIKPAVFLTHKVALDPTDVQATACSRHAGYARVAWNRGVAETRRALAAGEPDATSHDRLRALFNSVKDVAFPWCREQSQRAAKYALIDLGNAWARF